MCCNFVFYQRINQLQQIAKKKKEKKKGKMCKTFCKTKKDVHLYIEHLGMYF